ncbi:streptomycin 6-kinase [Actinomadura pelletieri DSM 43383]|uniref:Streptomycin 6-kinase n=2 Tax=Actinomadura pelletieri TaxID=111805 RepID=A0A495QX26_9ACTN|nr:streptomycin 6-kinase [Actinomadura pelletieri DSM 43383]
MVLKAAFDPRRLAEESAAFAFWRGQAVPGLVAVEEDLGVLVTELVEPGPGGAQRPRREAVLVAQALDRLHEREPNSVRGALPTLVEYYADEVVGRMTERDDVTGRMVDRALVATASRLALSLPTAAGERERVLHADLYRENVLFDPEGRAVFIDPLPKIGPPVFDWAFWSVYYDFHHGFEERLHIAVDRAENADTLVPWCLLLAVDGLLYFLSIEDGQRVTRARKIIEVLRESGGDGATITARR